MSELTPDQTDESSKPRSWRRRLTRSVILYILVPYIAVTLIFALFQRHFIYAPTRAKSLKVADAGLDPNEIRDVQIECSDGNRLNGWLLMSTESDGEQKHPLVIYFPGNAQNRHERIHDLREVAAAGFDVLIFDYRGYGDSSGAPSERAMTADARLIWRFAIDELEYDERQIIIFGESLGGAVALSLWSEQNKKPPEPAAVILNATFASMSRVASNHLPFFPVQLFLLDRWPSIERIPRVRSPITIFHGTADEIVPVSEGRALAGASENARLVEIPGAMHNDIPMGRLRRELERLRASIEIDRDEPEHQ